MADVARKAKAPTSSRDKTKFRVTETVKNKLIQLNIDNAEDLANVITEILAEGNSKEVLNEKLTKCIGVDKLKSSFFEWLYGYSKAFFPAPPTPALSEDESDTDKAEVKDVKAKRRSFQTRSRSGSKSSISSIGTDRTGKSKKSIHERKSSISSNASNSERVRCQYWPECNRGDQCKFWHPKELCKNYPNCPYGDKCLYIHPAAPETPVRSTIKHNRTKSDASSVISSISNRSNVECKFGANCNRADCKYSHPSPAAIAAEIAKKATAAATESLEQTKQELQKQLKEQAQLKANASAKSSVKTNVPCHFFPNCKNPDCPYQHPSPSKAINDLKTKKSNSEFNVLCRYDGNCTRADCKFIHTKKH